MKFLFFLLLLLLVNAFATDDANLIKQRLQPNEWRNPSLHMMKGKYLKIQSLDLENVNPRFSFYDDSKLKNLKFEMSSPSTIIENSKKVCTYGSLEDATQSQDYVLCQHGYCLLKRNNLSQIITEDYFLKMKSVSIDGGECKYKVDFAYEYADQNDSPPTTKYYFKIDKDPLKNDYASVFVNNKSMFLDIRKCKEKAILECETVEFSISSMEEIDKKHHLIISKKSSELMNVFQSVMSPCLKKRDLECVKKNIALKVSTNEIWLDQKIDKDIFDELEQCLKYENLLPNQLASKGKNKFCIFNEDNPYDKILTSITYLEAISNLGVHLPSEKAEGRH